MTVSLNFWFDPKNQTAANQTSTSSSSSTENKEQNTEGDEIQKEKEQPKKREITPTEELALKREVESIIHEHTRDHKKVILTP
jgi:hypothetical protein